MTINLSSITAHGPKVTARIVARESVHEQLRRELEEEAYRRKIESLVACALAEDRRERDNRAWWATL